MKRKAALLLIFLFSTNLVAYAQQVATSRPSIPQKVVELEKNVADLREQLTRARSDQKQLSIEISEMEKRIGDAGWKSLDANTKLSSLQWQTLGFVFTVILAVSFGGWQGYRAVREKLEAEIVVLVKEHEGVLRSSTGATLFGELSMGMWKQYSAIPNSPETLEERKRWLDTAIRFSGSSLKHAQNLASLDKTKYVDLVTNVLANHAYWLAEDDRLNSRSVNGLQALLLAKQAFSVASGYLKGTGTDFIHRWPDWIESYCFVLSRFGTDAEKAGTKEIIRAVCDDVRVDPAWKAEIRKEYGIANA